MDDKVSRTGDGTGGTPDGALATVGETAPTGLVRDKAMLLWIDLEMTGLDPAKDRILEVAAIVTNMQLEEIARYEAVIKVPDELIKERMVGEFWEKNSKARDALIAQNPTGRPVEEVEKDLLDLINKHSDGEVYLAGNSIHQDRKFIEREMPELNAKLHYRMLDVSAWKIYFEHGLKKKFIKPETHRALDDINGSIEELQ